jgi:hypothetical protein
MADSKKLDFELLNYLTTEIIVLNESLMFFALMNLRKQMGGIKMSMIPLLFPIFCL